MKYQEKLKSLEKFKSSVEAMNATIINATVDLILSISLQMPNCSVSMVIRDSYFTPMLKAVQRVI